MHVQKFLTRTRLIWVQHDQTTVFWPKPDTPKPFLEGNLQMNNSATSFCLLQVTIQVLFLGTVPFEALIRLPRIVKVWGMPLVSALDPTPDSNR